MYKSKWLKKMLLIIVMVGAILNITSCGTLFYPERMGQMSGRIDPGILILDGIGLLCFIIPGVIAFVVDFSNGTIYLPSDGSQVTMQESPTNLANMKAIKVNKGTTLTNADIEWQVEEHTGEKIDLSSPDVKVTRLDGDLIPVVITPAA